MVVARNVLGTINPTLQTLIAAAAFREGLAVAGVVLNNPALPAPATPVWQPTARNSLPAGPPVLGEVTWGQTQWGQAVICD